jgi:RNA polymerase sigma-70 factor (ECF subfamily)
MPQSSEDPALFATRQSLLLRLKDQDDQEGWREFFDSYWRLIYSFCLKAGLPEIEAEEVVQETMISVAKQMPQFRYDRSKGGFKAWLLTLVQRRMVDRLRKQNRWNRVVSEALPLEGSSETGVTDHPDPKRPELDVLWASEWEGYLINKALQQVRELVSEKQYLIYEMHVLREVPISTVVANLQTSTMAVYVAKHRVGKLLREELGRLKLEEEPQ